MASSIESAGRRSRRSKQASSLSGMFSEEMVRPVDVEPHAIDKLKPDTPEFESPKNLSLKDIALRLRRAKRSLLLSAASTEQPVSRSESFRTIVMHLSDLDLGYEVSEDFSRADRIYRPRGGSVTSSGSK